VRSVDRAGMIAKHLQEHPAPLYSAAAKKRLADDVRRALTIRESIMAAGIKLPPLRDVDRRGELPAIDPEHLSIAQIAIMGGLDRSTITRRLKRLNGSIAEKVVKARQSGVPVTFTTAEALQIINTIGIGR
jgi:hypothetical protein